MRFVGGAVALWHTNDRRGYSCYLKKGLRVTPWSIWRRSMKADKEKRECHFLTGDKHVIKFSKKENNKRILASPPQQ